MEKDYDVVDVVEHVGDVLVWLIRLAVLASFVMRQLHAGNEAILVGTIITAMLVGGLITTFVTRTLIGSVC